MVTEVGVPGERKRIRPYTTLERHPRQWAIGVGLVVALIAVACGWPHWQTHSLAAGITLLECGTTAAAGVLLGTGRGTRPTGLLLLTAAFCWAFVWLAAWNTGASPLISAFAQSFFFLAGSVGILYYPDGRLHGRPERWWAVAAAVVLVGGQVVLCLTTPPSLYGYDDDIVWPRLVHSARLETVALGAVTAATLAIAAGFAAVIWWRQRRLYGVERALTLPVLTAVAVVGVLSAFVQTGAITGLDRQLDTYLVQGTLALSVPLALLAVGLRRRWAEVAVADQLLQLTRPPSAEQVRNAFRAVLRDPTLDVWFWVPRQGQYVDHAGRVVPPPDPDAERWRLPVVTEGGEPLAVVDTDPALRRHEGLVMSALLAGRRALENAQLQTEVQARIEQVRVAQMRVLQAEAAERQRMERDLHDGAQQRLVALAMRLAAVEASVQEPEARAALREAREAATQALGELRAFARGIHPGQLTEEGLPAALESLAERLDLAVELQIADVKPSPGLERALYLALAEALTNAARHASVDEVVVRVYAEDRNLVGEVVDAGAGGARAVADGGLAGIRDQARALGGEVEILSTAGVGTTVRVRLPLD
ncbi:sensor histidine kinase [Cryptosporangium aurantiacum]|uniref:histidine kinase n=1 Tax=Cryptosporangium aurantiacum TaxID=134849 RepID=A0A1M7IIK2_9ACTN|nr:histidine kinase [Cryptosporangium aurantiacum]SHM40423.1 Histidine kinase [Cryptosporangium aurantiacum]